MRNKNVWSLTNISEEVKHIAREKAKREHKTISGWISDMILSSKDKQSAELRVVIDYLEARLEPIIEELEGRKGRSWWRRK